MEAKDTVMPLEYSALDGLHCAGISDEEILRALQAQAEISFKAGIREVVEFIEARKGQYADMVHCENPNQIWLGKGWQAKLKEWGL